MTAETVSRPLRKDAARNRALLLEAARAVFAERGLEASLDDIAHRAGLGVGTAYRHFANKQEVATALFTDFIDRFIEDVHRALAIEDPWEALVSFFEAAAASQAHDRGLHQVMVGAQVVEHSVRIREELTGPLYELFDRAKRAGALRADADPHDAAAIFAMLGVVYDMASPSSPELWRRYLALLLDGLRATDRPPLPAPPLLESELDEAMAAAKAVKSSPPQS